MTVGVGVWDLHLAGCGSLKDKRQVLRSLKDRLHRQFNVSVAETDHQDRLQRAEIAVSVVSSGRRQAESVLSSADRLIGEDSRARVIDYSTTFY